MRTLSSLCVLVEFQVVEVRHPNSKYNGLMTTRISAYRPGPASTRYRVSPFHKLRQRPPKSAITYERAPPTLQTIRGASVVPFPPTQLQMPRAELAASIQLFRHRKASPQSPSLALN
ncbi:hypothetical protein BaRGS_00035410 [Batillaria attramentaria]|uniref:Uncharacterized protein n=1 Tax=Batillaria attramentaria TaxID=370345 RepID=A0ABD0JEM0_9CAEN